MINGPRVIVSDSIKKIPEYKTVRETVDRFIDSGVVHISSGQCLSASDMVYMSLLHQGIKSHLVECQLLINYKNDPEHPVFVGVPGTKLRSAGELETHIVCVTDTEPPMLIDTSISYLLPYGTLVVISEVSNGDNRVFGSIKTDTVELIYQEKSTQMVALAHQTSILNRITTDRSFRKDIHLLKKLTFLGIALSAFGFIEVMLKIFKVW
jgi:hypothetical protein